MSQNRVTFSARFLFTTSPLLNATKSRVISSAIKTKSQHDPKKNVKNGISMVNTPQPPTNCNDHAAAYPNGVFQSNGNLIENENTKIRITGVLIPLMACVVLTPLKIPNKMILDPARKCNNWQRWTVGWRLSSNAVSWRGQNKTVYKAVRFSHSIFHMRSLNVRLCWTKEFLLKTLRKEMRIPGALTFCNESFTIFNESCIIFHLH